MIKISQIKVNKSSKNPMIKISLNKVNKKSKIQMIKIILIGVNKSSIKKVYKKKMLIKKPIRSNSIIITKLLFTMIKINHSRICLKKAAIIN